MHDDKDTATAAALAEKIRQAEDGAAQEGHKDGSVTNASMPATGRNAGYDFVGSVIGGAVLGYALDRVVPSWHPWGMIGMVVLGFIAGVWAVWRSIASAKD